MAALTDKQRQDLQKAVHEYLALAFPAVAEVFREAAALPQVEPPAAEREVALVKRWVSTLRLQKRALDLESEVKKLQEELKNSGGPVRPTGKGEARLPLAPATSTLKGHRQRITFLEFHPVYSILASSSEDGSIILWDFENGSKPIEKQLKQHTNSVTCVSFDRSGKWMASSSADLSVKLWDFQNYHCQRTLHGHEHTVSAVKFVGTGDQLLSCSRDTTCKLWEASTGYCLRTFTGHDNWVRSLAVNLQGTVFASGGSDHRVAVWDVASGAMTLDLTDHTHVVECVLFATPAVVEYVVSEGKLAEVSNGHTVEAPGDDRLLFSASRDKTVRIWDLVAGECLLVLEGHDNWVKGLAVHWTGKYVMSAGDDRSIRVWDVATGRMARDLQDAHGHFVACLAVHPAVPVLASGGSDNTVKIWDCGR
mmetsp:Transcript_34309/g.78564  ORF Transcript_34309/g.78564 Transcript_34309/m.78564 type:complete len:422 (-) Transcript_34309:120-1385(-)